MPHTLIRLMLYPIIFSFAFGLPFPHLTNAQWRSHGGDPGGTRFSPLKQINRSNVAKLERAWTYRMGELERVPNASPDREPPAFQTTPLVVDGLLYLSTPGGRIIALSAENGREVWKFDSQANVSGGRKFHQHRGVSYWEGPSKTGGRKEKRVLFGTFDGRLIALNAETGKPCLDFGKKGTVDLRAGTADKWAGALFAVTSPPAIYKDLVITGSRLQERPSEGPSGTVRAFDVRSGKLIWQFHTIPRPGEPGHDSWADNSWKDRAGVNVWTTMSVDAKRGIIFLPLGSPAADFYGGDRQGQNLYGNSLVALDAHSGRRLWHYQMVHHDIWDYDLPAQPNLVTVRRDGRTIPAVAQITKMGLIFILDRLTGRPLFPVEERSVAKSIVPGEAAWHTQPFPLKPPPLARIKVELADLSTISPQSSQYCTELFNSLTGGKLYTPIGCDPTLIVPGTLGGGNWSGASFDPTTGYLYVNINELPLITAMNCQERDSSNPDRVSGQLRRYERFVDRNGWPCLRTPWGTLNAVDLNKGELVWKVALGSIRELEEKGSGKTGAPNLGGSIVTAGGLVFIGATTDAKFRAFDSRTGEELWSAELEASAHATPITYLGKKNGKQYAVIAAGGGGYLSKAVSDVLVAFALPHVQRSPQ